MKLTLGQAAKEVGLSKTAISNAIKNGRMSAEKTDTGAYAIDPAELFRVYPPKSAGSKITTPKIISTSHKVDLVNSQVDGGQVAVYREKVDGLTQMIDEKDKQIDRLIREKEKTEELLDNQTEQAKRITLLLEHKQSGGAGDWQQSLKSLETRIANQEKAANTKAEVEALEKTALEKQLAEQKKTMEEQERALKDAKAADLKREEDDKAERILKEQELEASQTWVSKMFGKKKTA